MCLPDVAANACTASVVHKVWCKKRWTLTAGMLLQAKLVNFTTQGGSTLMVLSNVTSQTVTTALPALHDLMFLLAFGAAGCASHYTISESYQQGLTIRVGCFVDLFC